jgi:hypothetical protein
MPKREHRQRHLRKVLAFGSEDRSRPERRPDARAPHGAKQEAEAELTGEARRREAVEMPSDPIAHGTCSQRELRLQPRHQEQHAHADQQNGRHGAKHAGVEAERKADGCHEEADGHERRRQAGGKGNWAEPVLARRRAHHDRQKRQHAWRKDR